MKRVEFGDWLIGELRERDWTQAKLAREAGVSAASISDVISGRRQVGKDLATAIAEALDIPVDQVFRAAGILPKEPAVNEQIEEIMHHVQELDEGERDAVRAFIETLNKIRPKKKK